VLQKPQTNTTSLDRDLQPVWRPIRPASFLEGGEQMRAPLCSSCRRTPLVVLTCLVCGKLIGELRSEGRMVLLIRGRTRDSQRGPGLRPHALVRVLLGRWAFAGALSFSRHVCVEHHLAGSTRSTRSSYDVYFSRLGLTGRRQTVLCIKT
jgi:hypothetical protein